MAILDRVSSLITWSASQLDRVIPPSTREQYYTMILTFAQEQPLIFTFLLPPVLLSLTPLTLFLTFTLSTLAFSLLTAAVFSIFWIGVALLVLIPVLFVTVSLGIIVGIWAVSSWLVGRWVYGFVFGREGGRGQVKVVNGKKVGGGGKNEYGYGEGDGGAKNY